VRGRRLHAARRQDRTHLPDGQLGTSNLLVPATEPFKPLSAREMSALLHQGPFAEYQLLTTDHYLIFYKSTAAFARQRAAA